MKLIVVIDEETDEEVERYNVTGWAPSSIRHLLKRLIKEAEKES